MARFGADFDADVASCKTVADLLALLWWLKHHRPVNDSEQKSEALVEHLRRESVVRGRVQDALVHYGAAAYWCRTTYLAALPARAERVAEVPTMLAEEMAWPPKSVEYVAPTYGPLTEKVAGFISEHFH